jgi:nitric oxide reductase subunit C
MNKLVVFFILFFSYSSYSVWVYTKGTDRASLMTVHQQEGKQLWQQYNCQSCHQIFGLGGYLGPELTTVISDKKRGEAFAKTLLENGGSRMPNFHFKIEETESLIDYLKYVDTNAFSYKSKQL